MACENGLLRIQDRALLPHGPGFFNLGSVPFAYDPAAQAPTWERFLAQVWPDDADAIAALQEWFGYVLSGRTDQQKILLIVGPSRSGKGTIARVLKTLVGKENLAGPTLASLGTNFGLSTLVGKPLAVISDARLSGNDNSQVVERLLTISGEDTIDVDRKWREVWTGKLPTRLMMLSNELPHFGDSSGVIAKRFVLLSMRLSWLGKEDPTLVDRLTAEMPGILNWALDGLARLQRTGRITQPQSSREAVTTMQDTASPPAHSSGNAARPDPRAACPWARCGRYGASGPRTTASAPARSRCSAATCSPWFLSSTAPALATPTGNRWPPTAGSRSTSANHICLSRDSSRLRTAPTRSESR